MALTALVRASGGWGGAASTPRWLVTACSRTCAGTAARHRNSYREGGKSASERMFFGYRVSAEEAERGLEVFWAMQNKLGPARRYPSSKESHHGSAVVSRPPGSDWVTAR